jgi:hypothetical protein
MLAFFSRTLKIKPMDAPHRIFLLSPAHCGGERAKLVYRDQAQFALALQLRTPQGAMIGDVFSFLSGLYFRGKLSYARAFANPPGGAGGALVITTDRGLLPADTYVTLRDLRAMGSVSIDAEDDRYRAPLMRSAARLLDQIAHAPCEVVLLGSIATGKYVDLLLGALGDRLHFPAEFVGRGDMSRGGLLLRCVDQRRELKYLPAANAIRRGHRPAKLAGRRVAERG